MMAAVRCTARISNWCSIGTKIGRSNCFNQIRNTGLLEAAAHHTRDRRPLFVGYQSSARTLASAKSGNARVERDRSPAGGGKEGRLQRAAGASRQPAPRNNKSAQARKEILAEIQPREISPETDAYGSLGEEISGQALDKQKLITVLNSFFQNQAIRELAKDTHHIDDKLFTKAFISFRRYCLQSTSLPPELHVKFCDIINGHGHTSDVFPFFLGHARAAFPHLECHEELRKISDLGLPHSWYPEARAKVRKIIFHAGPTNSGKTYGALQAFMRAKSGIYCGPLKLLAVEIFNKAQANNTPCDLVTGEDRRMADPDGLQEASHVSCTVEMTRTDVPVEVAVIDEIQMMRDPARGWAWTRALLGVPADEVHICGEEAAVDLVRKVLEPTPDILEVKRYKRLSPLIIENKPLGDLSNVRDGDCIVCFSKDHLYKMSQELERLGHQVAVVYGTLPPGAKMEQCKRFNQKESTIMVATDAIGMGLNLSISRIIFYSLVKTVQDAKGNRWKDYLDTSHCLQIAGRAGRFKGNTAEPGYATTLHPQDHKQLCEIMSRTVPPIERAGLHPTADQIELFAFHLPHLTLANLIDLFVDLCEYDSEAFFICDMEVFKLLANTIQHIAMPLRSRYVFCSAPVNTRLPFSVAMFTKFARQYGSGEPVTAEWVKQIIGWPCKKPRNFSELAHLEAIFDVSELYLWLGYRFPDMFPQQDAVRDLQKDLVLIISSGVANLISQLGASPTSRLAATKDKDPPLLRRTAKDKL